MPKDTSRRKTTKKRWKIRTEGSQPDNEAPFKYFYSLPDSKLLALLILVSIIIVIVLLCVFRKVMGPYSDVNSNSEIGTYLGIVGLPVGVILSFIVASAWSSFANAQTTENSEATQLFSLYNLIGEYPEGGEAIQQNIREYTAEIVDVEFDLMSEGIQPMRGFELLTEIGDMIYSLEPTTPKESVLYSQAISLYRDIQSLRIVRMNYVSYGLASELWWVLILGVVVVIAMSFFIHLKYFFMQVIVTALITLTLVSMLFLIIAFNFPYRGDFGLDATPFQTALANMS